MLELEHGYPVVDIYSTLAPDAGSSERGWTVAPDRMERELAQAGIVRSLVVPPVSSSERYVGPNNWVARVAIERPFVAGARIAGSRPPGSRPLASLWRRLGGDRDTGTGAAELQQYAYDDRFHAFAIAPAADGLPDGDLLAALEDAGRPVVVDGAIGLPPDRLADRLGGHDFPVVLGHFGGRSGGREWMAMAIDTCEDHDGVYLDTSFVRHRDLLERAHLEHPDRVLFGSAAPACHPDVSVMEVLSLDVSEDLLRRSLWKNASRLIGALDPEGAEY